MQGKSGKRFSENPHTGVGRPQYVPADTLPPRRMEQAIQRTTTTTTTTKRKVVAVA